MAAKLKIFLLDLFRNDRRLLIAVCSLMFFKRFFLHHYEINYEEGKEIECILQILDGKLVFRDFHWQYGPFGIYFVAFLFKIFGTVNLLIPRWTVTLVALATTYYSYKSARFYLKPSWAFWAALMASSGLAARENTYGHGFAYLGMIASFYFLMTYVMREPKTRNLVLSGSFAFLALLAKPVVFGIGAVASGAFCLIVWGFMNKEPKSLIRVLGWFLMTSLIPGCLVYGYLLSQTSLDIMFKELFPMFSGTLNVGKKFFIPPILPTLEISSPGHWVMEINIYLANYFRWWLVVCSFLGGLGYYARRFFKEKRPIQDYAPFLFLLVYLLLIDSETIILGRRPTTFFINMLPCYILIAIFFDWLKENIKPILVWTVALGLAFVYFIYPPVRLGIYHAMSGKALELKYAETIKVPPYTWESYNTISAYIKKNSPQNTPFLFAGYDSFVYLFAERPFYFPEDYTTFVRASFNAYNRDNEFFSKVFFEPFEKNIVKRLQANPPSMILIPSNSISEKTVNRSFFLKYLTENWQLQEVLNRGKTPGPFDKANMEMNVYVPAHTK